MTTQNQVVATKKITPLAEVCSNIVLMKPNFEEALRGTGVDVDRFIQVAKQGLQTHRDARKLLEADRKSLNLAFLKAASDGLMLDGRESALVVFGNEVVFMPMVQGLVKLARNSGAITNIESAVVYANDKFTYIMGVDAAPRHEADWFGDSRGEPIGAWAVVTLASGEKIPAMLSKSKIMRVASKSKNSFQYDPKKGDAWEEWWKKTAVKNVLKYAPRSTALEKALQHDNEVSPIDVTPEPTVEAAQDANVTPIKRKSRLDKVKEAAANDGVGTPHDAQTGEVIDQAPAQEYVPGEDRDEDVI